jgi:cell surface protein SprA
MQLRYPIDLCFQNLIKLEYTPTEDDIQKIEVGNVSLPLNSSLIRGAQFVLV